MSTRETHKKIRPVKCSSINTIIKEVYDIGGGYTCRLKGGFPEEITAKYLN